MPFLFIDYDQGGGGEYFCSCLSQSPQSEVLEFDTFNSGRTKVRDVFNQEFLKPIPNPDLKISADKRSYTIVPTHRHTSLAKKLFKNIKSIRIQYPVDNLYFKFLKHQQLTKVLLAVEPTDTYFVGFLKILAQQYNNTSFLSKVNRSMDNLTLTLLAQGIEPTDENRQQYITKLTVPRPVTEPNFEYDLTIPYETLFNNTKLIVDNLQKQFGINVKIDLFKKYREDFDLYQAQT